MKELIASEPIPIDIVENVDSDSDEEEWMPEPVDANIGKSKILFVFFSYLK